MVADPQTEHFIQLLLEHRRAIYGLILALVPNRADADDLFQETSARMWRNAERFELGTDFVAWARSFVRFSVLKFYERRNREGQWILFDESQMQVVVDRYSVLTAMGTDRRREALQACIKQLPENSRELLRLRYESGASIKLVAQAVGRPLQSISKSLSRIHQLLVECIERKLAGEGRS